MANTPAERQKSRYQRKLVNGLKRRAFYVNQEVLDKLTEYKIKNNLDSLDKALVQMITESPA